MGIQSTATKVLFKELNVGRFISGVSELRPLQATAITIRSSAAEAAVVFKAILPIARSRISQVEFARGYNAMYGEFVRGAILRNANGQVLIHVTNALIGYDGNGPFLSKKILQALGQPDIVFETLNNAARGKNQSYDIVYTLN